MYYVYLLKSKLDSTKKYIGFTTNVKNRLDDHNRGKSFHTAKYKPWILHSYFVFFNKEAALKFEKYLKSHSGRAFSKKHFW